MENHIFTVHDAKQIDMVEYLGKLGYHPTRVKNHDYWYLSPLREETEASFKINRNLNAWYDHGLGVGGNIIDFGIAYHKCSVKELLAKLRPGFSFHPQTCSVARHPEADEKGKINILKEGEISSVVLQKYLTSRSIPLDLANQFCKEITFELYGRKHVAVGFQNNSGGYELRNPYFKGSSSPKDISFIDNGSKDLSVFEGFFDFLSLLVVQQKTNMPLTNCLVFNSLAFFERLRPEMAKHLSINLFFDRDPAGTKCTARALHLGDQYKDRSSLFQGHKDVNEWLTNKTQTEKQARKIGRHF
jgi:hypothetical protein